MRTAEAKASIAKARRGATSSEETKAKLRQIAQERANDPNWRERVSVATRQRMRDPEVRTKHLAALERVFTEAPNGNNFRTGGRGAQTSESMLLYATILCPIGYQMDCIRVVFGSHGRHYTLDFAHVEAKVNIEIDGSSHRHEAQKIRDAERDKFLRSQGWKVIRIRL